MGAESVHDFMRLYTAPGVDHVGSGAPANVDMLSALVDWRENGKPPGPLTVVEQSLEPTIAATRSLPLCEWPDWPHYNGGDAKNATSYSCIKGSQNALTEFSSNLALTVTVSLSSPASIGVGAAAARA